MFQPFPGITGIVSALFYSVRILGGFAFSGLLAWLPDKSQLPLGLVLISSALLAGIIFKLTLTPTVKTHE